MRLYSGGQTSPRAPCARPQARAIPLQSTLVRTLSPPTMPADLQKITPTHDAMLDWLLTNPGSTLAEMGAHFGYSVSWLSMIINSDLFQQKYESRRQEVNAQVAASIPQRLSAIASVALEKIQRHVELSQDKEFLVETADKVLGRLGYGAKGNVAVTVNAPSLTVVSAPRDALANARELMARISAPSPTPLIVEGQASPVAISPDTIQEGAKNGNPS